MFQIKEAKFLRAVTKPDQAPRPTLPAVAFVGRSNSGKSSLLNTLTQRKGLARTSSTPGRTQEIVYFNINDKFYFVDLPGYGYAKAPESVRKSWGPMIEGFLRSAEGLKLVIIILDIRRDPGPQDRQMIDYLESLGLPYIFAVTKSDKLTQSDRNKRMKVIQAKLELEDNAALLPFSAVTSLGRKDLLTVLGSVLTE